MVSQRGGGKKINVEGTHVGYFPQRERGWLLEGISATADLAAAVSGAELLILAVPSNFLEGFLERLRPCLDQSSVPILSLVKGLRVGKGVPETTSAVVRGALRGWKGPTLALGGGNIYSEMMQEDSFAEATIAYEGGSESGRAAASRFQTLLNSPRMHTTVRDDLVGVELAGALKNVVSLACGFAKGLEMGANTQAAVLRAGLREMPRFARACGLPVRPETFSLEAAGVGDLFLTCSVGRGQRLAAAFVQGGPVASPDDAVSRWARLESEFLGGMKIPDWHNARAAYESLRRVGCTECCPLLTAVHTIGFVGSAG
eukprot:CAMPEP_0119152728 /NCGR_PEP_ID=MMETSP1310-20130426/48226_1 /TAXON_ID=464262 /ORGANISM="Genus nov. species nov., Strain RCC2339" /LENGTH=314 /DNA_ID=CAMNT_0007145125 /DNA_START=155 /DNA_END=1096 /DNA_ORIENTATION=+